MLTKTISYTDIDDQPQTETYCFQISLAEMSAEVFDKDRKGQTLKDRIERMTQMDEAALRAGGVGDLMKLYQEIIKSAVGKRRGKLFVKNDEVKDEFLYSGAYDRFFLEMLNSSDSGASMIAAMMPADIRKQVEDTIAVRSKELGVTVEGEVLPQSGTVEEIAPPAAAASTGTDEPKWLQEGRYPTSKELMNAGPEETRLAMKMKSDKAFG